ncbi:alpha-L-fucosidase [Nematostella vectensis]|uniref:alpha-L-fucosidase n=1 Tax=Nematostella vectensis TaxID=45351 RepID=UPI0013904E77|nr:alpha-L-fucosidase [Nematostella vectensis]
MTDDQRKNISDPAIIPLCCVHPSIYQIGLLRMASWASIAVLLSISVFLAPTSDGKYQPNWDSLDTRPLPDWYDRAKFGIIMHWGVYSVPSFGVAAEWFWNYWKSGSPQYVDFMKQNYPPGFSYADFAPMFKAEFFDPDIWASLISMSGAKYFVITSKHHEGWTNWRSNVSWNWNSVDNGPHRDLIGDLADSIRASGDVKFGLYFSHFEWFNPIYLTDQANNYNTDTYSQEISQPQLHDLVTKYKPEYIFSDGDVGPDTYWKSTDFLAWLFNQSPVKDTVVVNDRWGSGTWCKHGSVWTCSDRYNPGKLVNHKWENAMTVDKMSWGFRRNSDIYSYMSIEEIIAQLVSTVSCGGNLLMNVGPTADGRILPVFQERLIQIGQWLGVNGEAIYDTTPWRVQNSSTDNVWYTAKRADIYATILAVPDPGHVTLSEPIPAQNTVVTLLGYKDNLQWSRGPGNKGVVITMPFIPSAKKPLWAWSFKITNVK